MACTLKDSGYPFPAMGLSASTNPINKFFNNDGTLAVTVTFDGQEADPVRINRVDGMMSAIFANGAQLQETDDRATISYRGGINLSEDLDFNKAVTLMSFQGDINTQDIAAESLTAMAPSG